MDLATHNCKFPGCTNEARSRVGRYSYCDEHQGRAAAVTARGGHPKAAGTTVAQLEKLKTAARAVDRRKALAEKLTRQALEAKRVADEAEQDYREQLRAAISTGPS